jgi:hypothetical protein
MYTISMMKNDSRRSLTSRRTRKLARLAVLVSRVLNWFKFTRNESAISALLACSLVTLAAHAYA